MIDRATVQRITEAADIVEVVSDYVHLTKRGANYVGLCPFHNERTPSFSVNKSRNFCHCFSCHKGGSPVNFIMEKEGISYREALLQLAKKYNIPVEERELSSEEKEAQNKRESMFLVNDWAMQKMQHNLRDTEEGRDIGLKYFYERGVTSEAINKFQLGYALDSFDALVHAAEKEGYSLDVMREVGLIGLSQKGSMYDRFRGRVIFPICNSSGKVIAFGGRDLKGGPAKYINSPESEIYKKSNELYGMFQARSAIVSEDKVFLVEGYMDVIGMWQSGIKNCVASSGTALTDGQIALLHRFTKNITLIYDGDPAGIKASLRGIDMLLSHGMNVRVLLLPDGDDPDSFARKNTPEQFREYLDKNETDIIHFKVNVLKGSTDWKDPLQRVDVVKSVVRSIACIPDMMTREIYVQECSIHLEVPPTTIAAEVNKQRELIVEQLKRERWKRSYPNENITEQQPNTTQSNFEKTTNDNTTSFPAENVGGNPKDDNADGVTTFTPSNADVSKTGVKNVRNAVNPILFPLEKKLIEYCVKYGFLSSYDGVNEDGEDCKITVVEYIDNELSFDNISFEIDAFAKVFDELKKILPDFLAYEASKKEEIEKQINMFVLQEREAISQRAMSLTELESEEKKLRIKSEEMRNKLLEEFTINYASDFLASHPDDDIRKTTTDLLQSKHKLSQIYLRQPTTKSETELLEVLLPRAISELKAGVLDIRLQNELESFRKNVGKLSHDEELLQMSKIKNLMQLRSNIAKDIGERIVSPKR